MRTMSVADDADMITLLTITYDGKHFGAGACTVTIGGAPVPTLALRAGDERWITTRDHAVAWLTERGLPAHAAEALIQSAIVAI
jgi:hypothetical protein